MCQTKIKNIFQEKLEIDEDIIRERAHITKGKTARNSILKMSSSQRYLIINLNVTAQ